MGGNFEPTRLWSWCPGQGYLYQEGVYHKFIISRVMAASMLQITVDACETSDISESESESLSSSSAGASIASLAGILFVFLHDIFENK